jgi:hypothetical protein
MVPAQVDTLSIQQVVSSELEQGEKLLWVGQPNPARAGRQAIGIAIFGIPWTLFALFWMAGASGMLFHSAGPPDAFGILFPLFGLPFVLIGFGMLSAPFWASRKALTQVYAITDKRAMIIDGGRSRKVQSFTRADMCDIERTELANGSGDLMFAQRIRTSSNSSGTTTTSIGFYGIPEVRAIEKLMLDTFKTDGS